MSFWAGLEASPQRSRTVELPATPAGRRYCTSCHEVSDTALEVDQTLTQVVPFVETWMETGSLAFVRSQRRNRNVTEEAPKQLICGVVAYLTLRLLA